MYAPFIESTLKKASEIANEQFGNVEHSVKPDDNNQVLTQTDLAIGKLIVSEIQRTYPDHNIIDEEAGIIDNGSNVTWVVDPIDGTSNFVAGLPAYGIMIGVLEDDTPVAGGVALPAFDEVYLAQKGNGATCNGAPIHVSKEQNIARTLVAYGIDGHQENPDLTAQEVETLRRIILAIRNLRTSNSAYDFMMTARGTYGSNMNQTSKIWDNVAPQIIIEEAGGVYTAFDGSAIDYTNALKKVNENFTVCCGSESIHRELQKIIHNQ